MLVSIEFKYQVWLQNNELHVGLYIEVKVMWYNIILKMAKGGYEFDCRSRGRY